MRSGIACELDRDFDDSDGKSPTCNSGLLIAMGQNSCPSRRQSLVAMDRTSVSSQASVEEQSLRRTARPSRRKPSRLMASLPNLSIPSSLATVFLLVLLSTRPVAAVRVKATNCLPDNFAQSYLQWTPKYADATFDARNDTHLFKFTAWGNVSGAQFKDLLPPENSPDWKDPDKTNGKILDTANGVNATTLYSTIKMLSYVPWKHRVDFCRDGLTNGTCPLPPVFNQTGDVPFPYGLPSINITNNMQSSYQFASFAATMIIIYGDTAGTNIGCVSATITPDLGNLTWVLKIVPLIVLLASGFAVVFAAIFSPWGTLNVFHWSSNYGRDGDLLRLVTPGFADCLQYIQFIVLSGGLSLSYPGFFQPVVSQVGWSALMFNESLVTHKPGWQSVQDGIYVTDAKDGYGLHALGQLIGMSESADIWAGMMVWLCVIILAVFVLAQAGFLIQWLYRKVQNFQEEDLRAKNVPFSIGNVIRIVFNFLLIPIVALSCFQLVAAGESPPYAIALAAITIAVLIAFAAYVLVLIMRTRPKSVLFDDLPTVLRYGPLYNTYSDEAAAFALIPVLLNVVRGIAIGAVQPSGISQVVLLAICEVIQVFTLHAFRPFQSPTSMNAYHTLFAALRLACVLLMVAFVPSLGVTEGYKGWIGYAILLIHAGVLALVFFLGALQTIVEVVARMLGAGGDDITGLTRGGLSKIFGMRQLSRRETHRTAPSRASQMSSMAMLQAEEGGRNGYSMPSSRIRSVSGASLGGFGGNNRQRSSSALDSVDMYSSGQRHLDTNSSYIPGTPGDRSTFSFAASPTVGRQIVPTGIEPTDPYYRPPRRTNNSNLRESMHSDVFPNALGIDSMTGSGATLAPPPVPGENPEAAGEEISRGATPALPGGGNQTMNLPTNREDYATREVDFYYGVRGPALNSDNPGRRLGTGPADPTGPVATATGWFRNFFGGTSKEKGKGFEVVRSSRMPPDMVRNGGFGDETPPEGIPVAMGVLRNGPIDSDDDDDTKPDDTRKPRSLTRKPRDLLTGREEPQESDAEDNSARKQPRVPRLVTEGKDTLLDDDEDLELPDIPRKSSKRNSGSVDRRHVSSLSLVESQPGAPSDRASHDGEPHHGHSQTLSASTLPFERTSSQKRLSSKSSMEFPGDLAQMQFGGAGRDERPASFGMVPQHGISRVDPPQLPPLDLLGSSAEFVDDFSETKYK